WAGLLGEFRIPIPSGQANGFGLLLQIADFTQEVLVGGGVGYKTGVVPLPCVGAGLKLVAMRQEVTVAGSELMNERVEAGPECGRICPCTWQRFGLDESNKLLGNLEPMAGDAFCHLDPQDENDEFGRAI